MKKRENEIEKNIAYLGDSAYDFICGEFDDKVKETSFKTVRDYAPYGDTEVEVCRYVDEDDDTKFRENMEKELDVDTVIDRLKQDAHFRDAIKDMVNYVVWNREIEV